MITSVAFFAYPVSDMTRARDFYERVLGLKLEHAFSDQWVEYDLGGTTFAITTADMNHQPGAKGGCVAFEVDDLDAEVARLKKLNVPFSLEPMASPVCRFAVVADPDGNALIIHRRNQH